MRDFNYYTCKESIAAEQDRLAREFWDDLADVFGYSKSSSRTVIECTIKNITYNYIGKGDLWQEYYYVAEDLSAMIDALV